MSARSTKADILADVNLWLATVMQPHPHHRRAVRWWRQEVEPAGRTVSFCRVTQLGLLRLLTNETVMGPSRRTPAQAWRDYEQLVEQEPVVYLSEPSGIAPLLRSETRGRPASPGLWTDAYLAAFARAAELTLATFDRGFRRFADLRLSLP